MFIRVYLQPTFFTKKTRGMFINLQDVSYVQLEKNSVHIQKQKSSPFIFQKPIIIPFTDHKDAINFYNEIQSKMMTASQQNTQVRWDRPVPDSLAITALENYKPELK